MVDEAGKDDLADRAEARERYADLEEAGRGWAAPLVVRRAMAGWRFDEATQLIERSEAVLDRRAQLARRARALGVGEPRTLEARYEGSERDLDVIDASLDGTQAALRALAAAEAAHDSSSGPLAAIGGWFSSADDELADARAAFVAGDSTEARAAAGRAGRPGRRPDLSWRDGPRRLRARHVGRRRHRAPAPRPPPHGRSRSRRRRPLPIGVGRPAPSILASCVEPALDSSSPPSSRWSC